MTKLRTLLIDDEINSLDVLEYELLSLDQNIDIIGKCHDAKKAAHLIQSTQPDIVFLDIEMPWLSGFEVLDQLDNIDFALIFVTAYNQYAIKAFKYLAYDYLLKPVNNNELQETLERLKNSKQYISTSDIRDMFQYLKDKNLNKRIPFTTQKGIEFIHTNDIIRFKADSNYTEIYTTLPKKITVSKTLKSIESILNPEQFIRVHQSHIINIDKLISYLKEDGGYLKMVDDSTIPLARSKKAMFMNRVKHLQ